jgi:hypothetical protein
MALGAVTNNDIDTVLSGIAGTPYTRVTDVSALPVAAKDISVEFEITSGAIPFWATYNQLSDEDMLARIVADAKGVAAKTLALKTALAAITTAIGTTYTYATYKAAIEDLRAIPEIRGYD